MTDFPDFQGEGPEGPPVHGQSRVVAFSLLGLALLLFWQAFSLKPYASNANRAWSQAEILNVEHAIAFQRQGHEEGWPPRAPLYPWLLSRLFAPAADGPQMLWINWFFLVLLCVAVFGITFHFRPDQSALIAVVLLLGAPLTQDSFTSLAVALPLAALTAGAYWALLSSQGFSRWPGSLAFGAFFALGMLMDWTFACFMLPAAFLGVGALFDGYSRPKVLAAGVLALAGFGPWYASHALDLALWAFLN